MSNLYNRQELKTRAEQYCLKNSINLARELGYGTQGIVYITSQNTALKVYDQEKGYQREKAVYTRLRERGIDSVRDLRIPRILRWEDSLKAFEMSIVQVPCVLDFGGAYLDSPPDHMLRDDMWRQQKAEEFGEHWEEAQKIIAELEYRGDVYLADVNSGNIKFT